MPRYPLAFLALAAVSAPASAQLYFINDFNPTLYTLSTSNGAATPIGASGVVPSTGFNLGLTDTPNPGQLLGSIPDFGCNFINTDGSGVTFATSVVVEGLAYDPVGNDYYATRNGLFFTVDPATSTTVPLASPVGNPDMNDLAYYNGQVYALVGFFGPGQGSLLAYDIGTSTWGFVGFTGIQFDAAGLAYNPLDGLLYAKGNQDTLLYSINPFTAATSIVGDTGIQFGGGLAYVPAPSTLGLLALAGCGMARRRR